ncbi:MAG: replication-associated recombination protein A [Selenomonadaceae bacterium]|nr:replication-associated recombination protein A [Selenomonadaceae bacterium]
MDSINKEKIYVPLAERMRPQKLSDFVGQEELLNFLEKIIGGNYLPSMIFFGAPGTGKTSLAKIISNTTESNFVKINAALSGVAELRKIIQKAEIEREMNRKTILFIDEIHRFNKSQQDFLLPYVEDGRIILIGATTENPFFEVNGALLSRVKIIRLEKLSADNLKKILQRAINLEEINLPIEERAVDIISDFADGDARIALNLLEQIILEGGITVENLRKIWGERLRKYDKSGDNHYDTISAFIKSMRGSDPDAAIFYLAKMIDGCEDIKFIARRILICAAEDVGNADPQALILANSAAQAVQFVGMPEARIILSQVAIYVSCAPKSNSAYVALENAMSDVKNLKNIEVPLHLRDSHYKGAKFFGSGKNYKYPHDYEGNFVKQNYLPKNLSGKKYYNPTENGYEKNLKDYLQKCW